MSASEQDQGVGKKKHLTLTFGCQFTCMYSTHADMKINRNRINKTWPVTIDAVQGAP